MTSDGLDTDFRLVSLIGAKLCHDLLGPISALSMVAESLEDEDPAMLDTSRRMLLESAGKALNRLSFYRAAVGRGTTLGSGEAKGLIEKVLAETKVSVKWEDGLSAQAGESAPALLKIAINLGYMVGHAVHGGGSLIIRLTGTLAAPSISVTGSGQRLGFEESARVALLAGAEADLKAIAGLDPRAAQPYFTGRLAAALGLKVSVPTISPAAIEVVAARA